MMSLSDFVKAVSGKTVLVDSNIIIYLSNSISPFNVLSRRLFELVTTEDGGQFDCRFGSEKQSRPDCFQ